MSLFSDLLRKAADKLEDEVLTEERFDDLMDELDGQVGKLPLPELQEAGKASLAELRSRRADVLHLGKSGLTMFVAHIAGGDDHAAQLEFIRNVASADDLAAGMWEDAGLVARTKRSEDEWKAEALDLIKTIGIKGAQVLLPLLLAAI